MPVWERRIVMESVERSIDVDLPLSTVYNQWTQFEDFPKFMQGVESVTQMDGATVYWVAEVAGKRREWNALITEQVPDRHIAWIGFGDPDNVGLVSFESLGGPRTRVTVRIEYEPEGLLEKVGHLLGIVGVRVEGDLLRFREFIESRRRETGPGWARSTVASRPAAGDWIPHDRHRGDPAAQA